MNTKYLVELSDEQQQHLEQLTLSGRIPARQMKRAQILLKSDQHWSYEQIAEAFDVSAVTIAKVRKACVKQGLEVALQCKKPAREYEHVLDGEGEAHLIAMEHITVKSHTENGLCRTVGGKKSASGWIVL
jgi:Homeodomain-like domain